MAELMMIIGMCVLAWLGYKFFEDAKEEAWERGFDDGRAVGRKEGKIEGAIETVCDLIEVDFSQ